MAAKWNYIQRPKRYRITICLLGCAIGKLHVFARWLLNVVTMCRNIAYVILYQKEPAFQPTQHGGFEIVFVFISFQWTDRLCDHLSKDVAAGLTDVLLYLGNSSSFTGTFYVQTSSERWWMRLLNGFCDFYEHIRKLVCTPVILCVHRWVTTQRAVFVRHSLRVYI